MSRPVSTALLLFCLSLSPAWSSGMGLFGSTPGVEGAPSTDPALLGAAGDFVGWLSNSSYDEPPCLPTEADLTRWRSLIDRMSSLRYEIDFLTADLNRLANTERSDVGSEEEWARVQRDLETVERSIYRNEEGIQDLRQEMDSLPRASECEANGSLSPEARRQLDSLWVTWGRLTTQCQQLLNADLTSETWSEKFRRHKQIAALDYRIRKVEIRMGEIIAQDRMRSR